MAMTPQDPQRPPLADARRDDEGLDVARLEEAADNLRERSDPRWVEISDRVLAKSLAATRRSRPVRAQARTGHVYVSEQVLIAYLREAIDDAVHDSALAHVGIEIQGRNTFAGATIQLVARFGVELLPIADRVRELARSRLAQLLGDVTPSVRVQTMHVHFCDVVRGDPHVDSPHPDS